MSAPVIETVDGIAFCGGVAWNWADVMVLRPAPDPMTTIVEISGGRYVILEGISSRDVTEAWRRYLLRQSVGGPS